MSSVIHRHVRLTHLSGLPAGRLVVYAPSYRTGTITIYRLDEQDKPQRPFYAQLKPYQTGDGKLVKAAVFAHLPLANYKVIEPGYTSIGRNITVFPGETAEVDFR